MTRGPAAAPPQPFYDSSSPSDAGRPRLLLISYVFPPTLASGSLRWQKLSHFVAERGWALDVITLDPACVRLPDFDRLADLPAGTRVYGVPSRPLRFEDGIRSAWQSCRRLRSSNGATRASAAAVNPVAAASAATGRPTSLRRRDVRWELSSSRGFVRAYSAWLNHARAGLWARGAASLALSILEPEMHEAVITSGPPHMTHEAGRLVARATGVPFVMDMRDPWSLAERLPECDASPLWFRLAGRHERRAVERAALVLTNTASFEAAMRHLHPAASERILTVMNGVDEDATPVSRHGRRFVIAYAGEIYIDRDPRPLFRAAGRVVRELALATDDFGIAFIGDVERFGHTPLSDIAAAEGLEGYVSTGPARPHREAMEFLADAAMLVSLPQDSDLAIPAKIFEYMRFDAWLLALATPESATGMLLRESGADVVAPGDVERMADVLRERVLQYRGGIRPARIARDGRYSRREQARVFLDALERTTGAPRHATDGFASSRA